MTNYFLMAETLSLEKIKQELGLNDEELKYFTPMVLLLYYSSNTYKATDDLLDGRLENVLRIARDRKWLNTYTIYANESSCDVEVFSRNFREMLIDNYSIYEIIEMLESINSRDKGSFVYSGYPKDVVHIVMSKLAIGMLHRLSCGVEAELFAQIEFVEGEAINMDGTMGAILLRTFDEHNVIEQMIKASRG